MPQVKYSTTEPLLSRRGSDVSFRNTISFQGSRGGQHFPGGGEGEGVQLFPGGPNAYFYRNLSKLGFSMQGVRTPIPLWIRA